MALMRGEEEGPVWGGVMRQVANTRLYRQFRISAVDSIAVRMGEQKTPSGEVNGKRRLFNTHHGMHLATYRILSRLLSVYTRVKRMRDSICWKTIGKGEAR